MILRDGENEITVTLTELTTIQNAEYVFVLFNYTTSRYSACKLGTDLSSYPLRYNKFSVTLTTTPDPLSAELELDQAMTHQYFIYEMVDADTFDFNGITDHRTIDGLVEQGKVDYLVDSADVPYYKDLPERRYERNV